MGKQLAITENGKHLVGKKLYITADGVFRKATKAYLTVNGVHRLCYKGGVDVALVFIDEIFKGTNTVERISIADAVIRHLSSLENTIAVVSTHDIELARGLETTLDTYHFNETIDSEQIRFSYTLIPGVVYTRNAISLLRLCGYPSSIH